MWLGNSSNPAACVDWLLKLHYRTSKAYRAVNTERTADETRLSAGVQEWGAQEQSKAIGELKNDQESRRTQDQISREQ